MEEKNKQIIQNTTMIPLRNVLKTKFTNKTDAEYLSQFYNFIETEDNLITMPPEWKTMLASIVGNDLYSALVFAFIQAKLNTGKDKPGSSSFQITGLTKADFTTKLLNWIKSNSKEWRTATIDDLKQYYQENAIEPDVDVTTLSGQQLLLFQATRRLDNVEPKTLFISDMVYLDFAFYVIVSKDPEKEQKLNNIMSLESQKIQEAQNIIFGTKSSTKPRKGLQRQVISEEKVVEKATEAEIEDYKARKKENAKKWREKNPDKVIEIKAKLKELSKQPEQIQKKLAKYDNEDKRYHILQHKIIKLLNEGYVTKPKESTIARYHLQKVNDVWEGLKKPEGEHLGPVKARTERL